MCLPFDWREFRWNLTTLYPNFVCFYESTGTNLNAPCRADAISNTFWGGGGGGGRRWRSVNPKHRLADKQNKQTKNIVLNNWEGNCHPPPPPPVCQCQCRPEVPNGRQIMPKSRIWPLLLYKVYLKGFNRLRKRLLILIVTDYQFGCIFLSLLSAI